MTKSNRQVTNAERNKAHRRRIREAGMEQVLFQLPIKTRVFIDQHKERRGMPNRSLALLHLIELGKGVLNQTT